MPDQPGAASVDLEALRRLIDVLSIGPNTGSESQRVAYFRAAAIVQQQWPAILAALERAGRVEAAAREWAEAWDASHGLTFTGAGPFPEIERRDRAELALRAALAPAAEGSDG